jgi:hypothetical protein
MLICNGFLYYYVYREMVASVEESLIAHGIRIEREVLPTSITRQSNGKSAL